MRILGGKAMMIMDCSLYIVIILLVFPTGGTHVLDASKGLTSGTNSFLELPVVGSCLELREVFVMSASARRGA